MYMSILYTCLDYAAVAMVSQKFTQDGIEREDKIKKEEGIRKRKKTKTVWHQEQEWPQM